MIISFKNGEKVLTMENADMRSICGGDRKGVEKGNCVVLGGRGSVHTKVVSSVEECLEYGGLK